MNVAALVSGGVDSSVVVHLLKEQGITPDIFYIRIGAEDDGTTETAMERFDCPAEEDIEITGYIAKKYGCRFEVVDLHREYWDNVVAYTIESVRKGLTPNPDIMCNKLIKFGAFEQRYGKDYDFTATGHYARTEIVDTNNSTTQQLNNSTVFLATAKDPVKDQTDFLSQLSSAQIRKLMFPIGHLMKSEVRAVAEQAALPSATRKDSQGICFLGKINYNDFLRRYLGEREGQIVELETGRVLGTHHGYWFHTIGQRKGLFLSGGPWFVVKKDIEANVLYVSQGYDPDAQYGDTVNLVDYHYLTGDLWSAALEAGETVDVKFKIRHTPDFTQGHLVRTAEGYTIHSDKRLQGIAAGQFATIYDNDAHLVVASGQIANSDL
ncbi:MAG: tRNA 2-thiouridine(34) synthase MnmA [Bacteroidales bacterium]|nr:tRNA 2-thiouridine(34) synthase MnmA [Bacteroidales bacterium]